MLSVFNSGDRAEVPLIPLEEARRYREVEGKWKAEFDSAKKHLNDWLKEAEKPHEAAVRQTKIDALKISDEEKAHFEKPSRLEGRQGACRKVLQGTESGRQGFPAAPLRGRTR